MADAAGLHLEMFDAIERVDLAALRDLYHPNYTYMDGSGQVHKGGDAGIAVAETYLNAFPDLKFEVKHHHVDGETSIIEFRATGTHQGELEGIAATGKRVEMVVCNVIEMKDGKIYTEREYYDMATLLKQLGAME